MKRLQLKLKMMFIKIWVKKHIRIKSVQTATVPEKNCAICQYYSEDADIPFLRTGDKTYIRCKIGADTSTEGKNCANFELISLII